jgi:hypothetical protein
MPSLLAVVNCRGASSAATVEQRRPGQGQRQRAGARTRHAASYLDEDVGGAREARHKRPPAGIMHDRCERTAAAAAAAGAGQAQLRRLSRSGGPCTPLSHFLDAAGDGDQRRLPRESVNGELGHLDAAVAPCAVRSPCATFYACLLGEDRTAEGAPTGCGLRGAWGGAAFPAAQGAPATRQCVGGGALPCQTPPPGVINGMQTTATGASELLCPRCLLSLQWAAVVVLTPPPSNNAAGSEARSTGRQSIRWGTI